MLLAAFVAASFGLLTSFAAADSQGPINFESYTVGPINGQQSWSDAGGYDANVVPVSGGQALQVSDATTSGSFGDQTFAPLLSNPASEAGNQYFTASFTIGTATATPNVGSHLSISPDNGQGGRMSYLRFEYQADNKVHVFFDDTTQSAPCSPAGCAAFSDTDIAQFAPGSTHTFKFDIKLVPGTNSGHPNDVVNIYEDGSFIKTGTTWEGYYRYDPESGPPVPAISTLIFKEGGDANLADQGAGYLIDDLSYSSSATPLCTPTGFFRDGIDLTAAQIGGSVTGNLDASGCNIGVYNPTSVTGAANISGANYYGVVVNRVQNVNITANIHDIGESPFNGSQHGVGVLYTTIDQDAQGVSTDTGTVSGTLSGSTISRYQKNGVVVSGKRAAVTVKNNTVTGAGHVDYIAQNGIEIASGASASVTGNTVSGHFYTPATVTACGLLFVQAGGVKQNSNTLFGNQTNLCNAGRGGGNPNP
jgi:hypothetical protein